jgi:hypothetical protein
VVFICSDESLQKEYQLGSKPLSVCSSYAKSFPCEEKTWVAARILSQTSLCHGVNQLVSESLWSQEYCVDKGFGESGDLGSAFRNPQLCKY